MSTDIIIPQETMIRSRTDPERYLEDFEEQHASREFLSIKNLDIYFKNIYDYHKYGGYWSIIYSKISNLIIIAFTISFSVFLIGFINWNSVIKCGNNNECKSVELIKNNIISNKIFGCIVIIYTIVFTIYFLWHLLNFIVSLSSLKITHEFYYEKLGINDDKLRRTEWSVIMNKIVSLQESVRLYHNKYLDALDITNRILRKENYMIAFINRGILDFRMPKLTEKLCWTLKKENRQNTNDDILRSDMKEFAATQSSQSNDIKKRRKNKLKFKLKFKSKHKGYQHVGIGDEYDEYDSNHSKKINQDRINNINSNEYREYNVASKGYLGNILEWNVRYIIFQSMFDDEMKVLESFKSSSSKLKWKFFWYGIGNLILTPFSLVFRIIFFFLQNAEEMHSNKSDLFSYRQWTSIAKLKFREFNELSHDFEERMSMSIKPSSEYINLFAKPPHILILSELISYISGSIVAVLLLLTFIDSSILLNTQLFNRSLVWFLAIFSALLAIARANIIYNNASKNHQLKMNEIARHTHYFPKYWQNNCNKSYVHDEFINLYQTKLNLFINELLNVFTTPFILMFTLPICVDNLLQFVSKYTDYIDGVGDICSYARFDFKRFQNKFIQDNIKNIKIKQQDNNIGILSPMDSRQTSDVSNVSSVSSAITIESNINTNNNNYNNNKPSEPSLSDKKLESSLLSFAINNPKWRSDAYQSAVLQGITEINRPNNNNNDNNNDKRNASSPSSSTAQLGLTFSELLASPKHSQIQSQLINYNHGDNEYLGYSNMSIHKISNPPNMQSTSHLFNTLQRFNYNNNNNSNIFLQTAMPSTPSKQQQQQNNMMLSEINESDQNDESEEESDMDQEDENEEYDAAPYKTLEMEASSILNQNDSHQQKK